MTTEPVALPGAEPAPATSLFGAAKDRAAAETLNGAAFLNAEEKDAMHRAGTPFWIVAAEAKEDKNYGHRARFTIVLDPVHAANGEWDVDNARSLDFGTSAFREALIKELGPILVSHKMVGPLYLAKFQTGNGKISWDIVEVPTTDVIPF